LYSLLCPWNVRACAKAAEGGHLEILKYLHENGCPWYSMACKYAVIGGKLDYWFFQLEFAFMD
jgi:hypothetical protein